MSKQISHAKTAGFDYPSIEMIDPRKLKPNPRNARMHGKKQLAKLKASVGNLDLQVRYW